MDERERLQLRFAMASSLLHGLSGFMDGEVNGKGMEAFATESERLLEDLKDLRKRVIAFHTGEEYERETVSGSEIIKGSYLQQFIDQGYTAISYSKGELQLTNNHRIIVEQLPDGYGENYMRTLIKAVHEAEGEEYHRGFHAETFMIRVTDTENDDYEFLIVLGDEDK